MGRHRGPTQRRIDDHFLRADRHAKAPQKISAGLLPGALGGQRRKQGSISRNSVFHTSELNP